MKIAVCGSGGNTEPELEKKAFEIGKEIAVNGALLLTGSCHGYPNAAAKGAISANGMVLGISPSRSEEEHVSKYSYPTENFTKIEYTGLGVPGRNFPLVMESDAIIVISGQSGTLIEFSIAFHENKVIGILEYSRGITKIVDTLAEICNKAHEKENIVYSPDPKELVGLVLSKLQ